MVLWLFAITLTVVVVKQNPARVPSTSDIATSTSEELKIY
jgi:hypothetical protein